MDKPSWERRPKAAPTAPLVSERNGKRSLFWRTNVELGFKVLPRRWVVERIFGRMTR
jgi:hypothetical protein